MRLLAEKVRPINPALANFITEARFVDDLNDSLATLEAANDFQECMYKAFAEFGVAGMAWHPETDYVELKIQSLHFGKVVRGLSPKTEIFKGDKNTFMPSWICTSSSPASFLRGRSHPN